VFESGQANGFTFRQCFDTCANHRFGTAQQAMTFSIVSKQMLMRKIIIGVTEATNMDGRELSQRLQQMMRAYFVPAIRRERHPVYEEKDIAH
jgi:hypothetical protein